MNKLADGTLHHLLATNVPFEVTGLDCSGLAFLGISGICGAVDLILGGTEEARVQLPSIVGYGFAKRFKTAGPSPERPAADLVESYRRVF